MIRRFKVLVFSLVAAFLFATPAYAEFSNSDSNNLASVKSYCSYLQSYLPTISSNTGLMRTTLDNILRQFTMVEGVVSLLKDIRNSLSPTYSQSFAQQLLDAVRALNKAEQGESNPYLGDHTYFYFNDTYFNRVNVPGGSGSSDNTDGYYLINGSGSPLDIFFYNVASSQNYRDIAVQLRPGRYYLSLSFPTTLSFKNIYFEGVPADYYSLLFESSTNTVGYYYETYTIIVKKNIAANGFGIRFNGSVNGVIYGSVLPYEEQDYYQDSINSGQDQITSDVNNAGTQQQQQEQQLWTNVNSYKQDISFNINTWSEAAAGLSYVTGVFMIIWNNSPTQVIVLSLMLGIAMLCIGRGVRAAVASSRNNKGDDG